MDRIKYQEIVKQVLNEHTAFRPRGSDMDVILRVRNAKKKRTADK